MVTREDITAALDLIAKVWAAVESETSSYKWSTSAWRVQAPTPKRTSFAKPCNLSRGDGSMRARPRV